MPRKKPKEFSRLISSITNTKEAKSLIKHLHRDILKAVIENKPDNLCVLFANDLPLNPNFSVKDGTTLLGIAAKNGYTEIVQILIENGADVNAKDILGSTILMEAIESENSDVVKILIENGADVNAQNSDENLNVLDLAIEHGQLSLISLLLQSGAINYHKESFSRIKPINTLIPNLILAEEIFNEVSKYENISKSIFRSNIPINQNLQTFLNSFTEIEDPFLTQEFCNVPYNKFGAATIQRNKENIPPSPSPLESSFSTLRQNSYSASL